MLEAPALIARLDDIAVMGQAIEERGRRFRVAEHARPFAEGKVGRDDDRGALVNAPANFPQRWTPSTQCRQTLAIFIETGRLSSRNIFPIG